MLFRFTHVSFSSFIIPFYIPEHFPMSTPLSINILFIQSVLLLLIYSFVWCTYFAFMHIRIYICTHKLTVIIFISTLKIPLHTFLASIVGFKMSVFINIFFLASFKNYLLFALVILYFHYDISKLNNILIALLGIMVLISDHSGLNRSWVMISGYFSHIITSLFSVFSFPKTPVRCG